MKRMDRIYYYMTGKLTRKKSGGKEVIMEFALGAIAIVLAIVFRDELSSVLGTVATTFNQKIQSVFSSL
jgi:hypothetical protein